MEGDVARMGSTSVATHVARVKRLNDCDVAKFATRVDILTEAASTLMPDGRANMIADACTSDFIVISEDRCNQAMVWHCLRLASIDDRIYGYGRLFRVT